MRRALFLAIALLVSGCASHVLIPPEERATLERALVTQRPEQYLRLSYYVTPFFGDASKRLLTPVPPEEVRLLDNPSGEPINPGAIERVLPAGARARIQRVEFPTSWVIAERVIYTPRTQPWVYLEVEGYPKTTPLILVLRPQLRTQDEFITELERFLSPEDLAPRMSAWSESVREAVREKRAIVDMPAEALEMAWGYPEKKRLSFDGPTKREEWRYPGDKRVATLIDGRLMESRGEQSR